MTRPTALVINVEAQSYHQGHTVSINGVQVAYRPYDGSNAEEVEREIIEALGVWLRRMTGWAQEVPREEGWHG